MPFPIYERNFELQSNLIELFLLEFKPQQMDVLKPAAQQSEGQRTGHEDQTKVLWQIPGISLSHSSLVTGLTFSAWTQQSGAEALFHPPAMQNLRCQDMKSAAFYTSDLPTCTILCDVPEPLIKSSTKKNKQKKQG